MTLLPLLLLSASAFTLPPLSRPSRTPLGDPPCPNLPVLVPLSPPYPSALASALQSLSSLFEGSLNSSTVPGGSLLVSYAGTPLLELHSGVAVKAASPRPVTPATLFRIASVSKVFPAVLLHQFADRGYLALDDPVAAHLPAFSVLNPFDSSPVTLRHLASHTAGLQREAPPGQTTAEVLDALASTYLILPPGSTPSYSNLGFALLGHALAEGSFPGGQQPTPLPQLLQATLLDPLGLNSTGFTYSPAVLAALAAGYGPSGAPVPFADLGWWYPAGSMYSSARDLTALAQALMLQAGVPSLGLSGARLRELLAPVFWNRDGASLMGTPWEFRASLSHLQATKGGNLPGYTASLALVPSLNLSVAALWNGGLDEVAWMDAAMAVLLPAMDAALAAAAPSPAYSPGPSPLDYVGRYSLQGSSSTVTVSMEQGMLLWREQPLLGVSFLLQWLRAGQQGEGHFAVAFPDSAFTCLLGEMEALRYQNVVFARGAGGNATATSVPGWVPGAVWERVA
jgi:CubicO group peptidase (beta-lactamase class C family)